MADSAITQIEVDQVFVWHTKFFGQRCEVRDGRFIQIHHDRLLQLFGVRISLPLHPAKIVVFSHGSTPVLRLFLLIGFPGGDDPDDRIVLLVAVTDDQDTEHKADAEHNEPILLLRMIGIEETDRVLVEEDRPGFLERHLVLSLILAVLPLVPLELNVTHMVSVRMAGCLCKTFLSI